MPLCFGFMHVYNFLFIQFAWWIFAIYFWRKSITILFRIYITIHSYILVIHHNINLMVGNLDLILNIQTSCWTSWTFLSMDDSILLLWLILVISNIIFTWSRYQYYGTPPIYSELGVHPYVFFCSQQSFFYFNLFMKKCVLM